MSPDATRASLRVNTYDRILLLLNIPAQALWRHIWVRETLAAMLGAFFILDDPIFNGLAISLIFGIFVSTLLTLIVIPLLLYSFRRAVLPRENLTSP